MECSEICDSQLRLIVEHFLEMRHVPELVRRVAMKSAADVIVNPAFGHFTQGEESHLKRMLGLFRLWVVAVEIE